MQSFSEGVQHGDKALQTALAVNVVWLPQDAAWQQVC